MDAIIISGIVIGFTIGFSKCLYDKITEKDKYKSNFEDEIYNSQSINSPLYEK